LRTRPRWRVTDLAARLADEHYRLDELHAGDLDARTSFELSYRELNPAQAHAFRLLSIAPGLDFGIPAAAALLDTSERGAASVLEALVDMALLETPVAGRYRFHDLIRLFAREHMANDPNSWDAALDRVLTFYRNAAKGWFERALGEFQPHPDAVPWFDAEGGNVLDAAEAACSRGAWTVVIDLAATLHHLLSLRGRAAELERLLSLAVSAAQRAGNVDAEVHATIRLAELMLWHGRAAETPELYEKCLRLTSQADDPARRAWILTHNGDALRDLGEPGRARAAYEEALRINESRGDAVGQGWVLTHLGGALRDLGELGDAESAYRRALVIADQGGDVGARVWTLTHMCWTLADLSRWDDAVDALGTALAFHQSTGDLIGQEGDLQSLGKLHAAHATADAARASDHYRAAADSYRKAADIAAQRHDMFAVDQWTRAANRSVAAGEVG